MFFIRKRILIKKKRGGGHVWQPEQPPCARGVAQVHKGSGLRRNTKGEHMRTMLESTGLKSHMLNNCNLKENIGYFRDPFKDLA